MNDPIRPRLEPGSESELATRATHDAAEVETGGERRRVLVIDDEPSVRELVSRLLRRAGFDVVEAPGGDAGIAAYRDRHPHLVLVDVQMPHKDGLQVIREILDFDPTARLIAMSGTAEFGGVDTVTAAHAAGASDFLLKPFGTKEILERVRHARRSFEAEDT